MRHSLHITVGRPSQEKANGVLQVVSAYIDDDVSGENQLCYHMSRSVQEPRDKYTHFRQTMAGVILCFITIFKNRVTIKKMYLYGGCQWRIMLLLILTYIFLRNKIPTILVPSGAYSENSFNKRSAVKKLFVRYIEFKIIKRITFIQALSVMEKKHFLKYLPKSLHNKIRVIPNAIKPLRTAIDYDLSELRVLYIGRKDIYGKGIDLVADAVTQLASADTKVTFSIYGPAHSIENNERIDRWAEASNGAIRNFGPVYGADKIKAFNAHNVFVLASSSEGLPTSLIEAAQTGIICLATAETNLEDDDWLSGILKIERNVQSIANTLRSLIGKCRSHEEIHVQTEHFCKKFEFARIKTHHDNEFR